MVNQSMINILINTTTQTLTLLANGEVLRLFSISTGVNGTGQCEGSGCTPLGRHRIADKFGDGLPVNAVFIARKFTGELYDEALGQCHPERDWILGRMLWLDGLENGFNCGVNKDGVSVDSKSRYIYIHGTPDTEPMGIAASHGCIRMRNADVVWLYDVVNIGTEVEII